MPIVISGLSKAFGEKQVLENFSCTLPAPGLTALMGLPAWEKPPSSASFWVWKSLTAA